MESLDTLKKDAFRRLKLIKNESELRSFEIEFFGRKQGRLTSVFKLLKTLPEEKKTQVGARANLLRQKIEESLQVCKQAFKKKHLALLLKHEKLDISFPGEKKPAGRVHPLTQIRREAEAIFSSLGFDIADGPNIETEYYNFDALNIPKDHPARDMWDTIWLKELKTKNSDSLLLRTHTSPVQIRYMEAHQPPMRIIVPGETFRYEATDASHDVEFMQLEGLMVDKDISAAHLKAVLLTFLQKLCSKDVKIRMRPSFFPFVEPGFEVDMKIPGSGKWMEVLGAGMVHQNVFKAAGYIKSRWQGFAFGIGLDRIAMIKYKIPDVRLLRSGDVRFLKQF